MEQFLTNIINSNFTVEDFTANLGALLDKDSDQEEINDAIKFCEAIYNMAADSLNSNAEKEEAKKILEDFKIESMSNKYTPYEFGFPLTKASGYFQFYYISSYDDYINFSSNMRKVYKYWMVTSEHLQEEQYPIIIGFDAGSGVKIFDREIRTKVENYNEFVNEVDREIEKRKLQSNDNS